VHFSRFLNVSRAGEEVMSEDKSFHMPVRQERREAKPQLHYFDHNKSN